ncbi:MAG: ABC-F family ATP-binding cassette domain-containing protein [Bacteriovoracaceae bacterium]|nr:ABC-F family ATP-binding cassette domain-containing protein [Bacteriovoracaceae bacterium]
MSILCSLKNIHLTLGLKTIFKNAELTIEQGDHLGLIGLNGQGKSTLFQILMGKVTPDISKPHFLYSKRKDPFDIFLVPQELPTAGYEDITIQNYFLVFYPKLLETFLRFEKVSHQISEVPDPTDLLMEQEKLLHTLEELGAWELQNKYINYLEQFKLYDHDRKIKNLSGGEKRKMALSIGLSTPAELILWDEPTNHLDTATIELFEEELMNFTKTFIMISHDRYLLNNTTDKILHIKQGEIKTFQGTYLDYLEYLEVKEKELQKDLDRLGNKHRRELAWMRQGIKARGTRSKKRVETFHNLGSEIAKLKSSQSKDIDFNLSHSGRRTKMLSQIEDGFFSYAGKPLLENVNIILAKGDKISLMGSNGAGKTTLIKILQEKLKLTSGFQKNAEDLKIVVFDQNRASLDDNKTLLNTISQGESFITLKDGRSKHVRAYLGDFLFQDFQFEQPVSTLSGGEKNRLQLALFMKQSADVWVFDEPTNDLDIETIEILEQELKSYESAVIVISHDRAFLDNTCKKTWLIHDKKLEIFTGGYSQVAPYLELLNQQKEEIPVISTPAPVQNNKNKNKLLKIEEKIAELESKKNITEDSLANFNFSTNSVEVKKEYDALTLQKKTQEENLQKLYQEWEKLSHS